MSRAVGLSVGLVVCACAALVPCPAAAAGSRSTGTLPPIVAEGGRAVQLLAGPAARLPQGALASDPGRDLSTGAEYDLSPDISGTRVVWWRYPDTIVVLDLAAGQTRAIPPPAGASNLNPSIDGDHVIFARLPSTGDWQILVYDIPTATEHQIATFPRDHGLGRFRISGGRIVWHAPRADGNWDIYLYDLTSESGSWLTSDPAEDADPDVDLHRVVWMRGSAITGWDVWVRDLETGSETRLADGTAARAPRISGDRVVWGDTRGASFSLYEHSLTTGVTRRVPTQTAMEDFLALDGVRVAWVNRSDDPTRAFYDDVFVYDFDDARETRVTTLPVRQWVPELSGDRLVWLDERTGSSHVFLLELPSLQAAGLSVDRGPGAGTSDGNGMLEPGETVSVVPSWRNRGAAEVALAGSAASFVAAAGFAASVLDGEASYGNVPAGGTADCGADCYTLSLSTGTRPAAHVDATFSEVLSTGHTEPWTVHVGDSFSDVGRSHWAYRHIETLLHSGIAAGCSATEYCPGMGVSRWQAAIFVARALAGPDPAAGGGVPGRGEYSCVPGGRSLFSDVAPDDPGCRFIHYLAAHGIIAGCSTDQYCPSMTLDRWQMAVMIARALTGAEVPASGNVPGLGAYDCRPGGVSLFTDVPPPDPGCRFVHYLAVQGITAGCGNGNYCPAAGLTRDQMAVFMTAGFGLSLDRR